ncbi:hypothetical protein AAG570_011437 [Ranatra chinensis]|uniref:Uncharacterized protein n=1 Tax=Ranatra chinensis TaxID=642074 RepID=A0ABD0YKM3_9HEMI
MGDEGGKKSVKKSALNFIKQSPFYRNVSGRLSFSESKNGSRAAQKAQNGNLSNGGLLPKLSFRRPKEGSPAAKKGDSHGFLSKFTSVKSEPESLAKDERKEEVFAKSQSAFVLSQNREFFEPTSEDDGLADAVERGVLEERFFKSQSAYCLPPQIKNESETSQRNLPEPPNERYLRSQSTGYLAPSTPAGPPASQSAYYLGDGRAGDEQVELHYLQHGRGDTAGWNDVDSRPPPFYGRPEPPRPAYSPNAQPQLPERYYLDDRDEFVANFSKPQSTYYLKNETEKRDETRGSPVRPNTLPTSLDSPCRRRQAPDIWIGPENIVLRTPSEEYQGPLWGARGYHHPQTVCTPGVAASPGQLSHNPRPREAAWGYGSLPPQRHQQPHSAPSPQPRVYNSLPPAGGPRPRSLDSSPLGGCLPQPRPGGPRSVGSSPLASSPSPSYGSRRLSLPSTPRAPANTPTKPSLFPPNQIRALNDKMALLIDILGTQERFAKVSNLHDDNIL